MLARKTSTKARAQLEVTRILHNWAAGDAEATSQLIPLVYEELQRVARQYLGKERKNHTLQATALVHEAYLRLVANPSAKWENRAHFYGIAAKLMRQILVDHARSRNAAKRGGHGGKLFVDEARDLPAAGASDLVVLDDALQSLTQSYPRKGRIVELKFFGGLTTKDIAEVLQISEKTVLRDWQFAKLWLCRELVTGGG